MRRTGACFCCLAMVALIFAAAPAKAGDNSIDVAVIVYDGVLTSDITAPLEVFGDAIKIAAAPPLAELEVVLFWILTFRLFARPLRASTRSPKG